MTFKIDWPIFGRMDKAKILKILKEKDELHSLPIDGLKLYILFLVFSDERGEEGDVIGKGSIDFRTLKRAFGEDFDMERLERACRVLKTAGLADATFRGIEGKEIFARNGYINFMIEYRLFDP